MSEETSIVLKPEIAETLQRVGEIVQAVDYANIGENLVAQIQCAKGIERLRRMLSADVMAPIMGLMNTSLGFKTDRDPNKPQKGQVPTPYGVDVVREAFIEAQFRGLQCVGNHWNIISSQCYVTKEGLEYLLSKKLRVTSLMVDLGVPEIVKVAGGENALVDAKASCEYGGSKHVARAVKSAEMDGRIAVKVFAFTTTDAILGKVRRKILKRLYDLIADIPIEDGDAGEVAAVGRVVHDVDTVEDPQGELRTKVANIKAISEGDVLHAMHSMFNTDSDVKAIGDLSPDEAQEALDNWSEVFAEIKKAKTGGAK